ENLCTAGALRLRTRASMRQADWINNLEYVPKEAPTVGSGPVTTLSEYQARVDEWITTYGVRYFSELNILAQLVEEVGEVARIVGRRYGEQSGDDPGRSLGDELADVLFVVACLANKTGIDLSAE